jgi:hypothetical protein
VHFYFLAEEGLAAFLTTNNSDVKSRMAAAAVATKAEVAAGEKCEVIDSCFEALETRLSPDAVR